MKKASVTILYNGKNITGDIGEYLLSVSYTDKAAGESDELQIDLDDSQDLWKLNWFPTKGDKVQAKFFTDGERVLDCGIFTVDEIECTASLGGDIFSIKALAVGVNKKVRTKKSYAHENKTLREIANTVAGQLGLTVEGDIKNVTFGRVTQYRESDLSFLHRKANEFGYTFNIRDSKLIFTSVFELEDKTSALQLWRDELVSFSFKDKTSQTFGTSRASYHDPKTKKVITFQSREQRPVFNGIKVDDLEIRTKAENQQQAEIKSRVALYRANSKTQQGSISTDGNIYLIAGNNVDVLGLGMFSGKYYIESSTHTMNRDGGYTTDAEIKRVGFVDTSNTVRKDRNQKDDSQ